jgi:hypothetical protein
MKNINKTSLKFLNKLISLIPEGETSTKIANSDSFMPLHVEMIGEAHGGKLYSVAHYGLQNGDMMRDPDMVFLVWEDGARPLSYRNDYVGVYRETTAYHEDGSIRGYYLRELRDEIAFAHQWFRNIREQQF